MEENEIIEEESEDIEEIEEELEDDEFETEDDEDEEIEVKESIFTKEVHPVIAWLALGGTLAVAIALFLLVYFNSMGA